MLDKSLFLFAFIFLIAYSPGFAQNQSPKDSGLKKVIKEVEQGEQSELELFRQILGKNQATRRDLFDVYLMQTGKFAEMPKPMQRTEWILKQKIMPVSDQSILNQKITRGDLALFLHKTGSYEKGMMYSITKSGYYAFRDMTRLGIINRSSFPMDSLTGSEMIGIFEAARKYTEMMNSWPHDPIEEIQSEIENTNPSEKKTSKTKEIPNEKENIQNNIRN